METQSKGAARAKRGTVASIVGMFLNLLLAGAKIAAGLVFGLVSVLADGINNLSDCGSSGVALVSFRIAAKPADKEHPFGHQRAEYVASMIIGCIILALAVELLRESVDRVTEGGIASASPLVFAVLGASVAVKGGMFFFYRFMSRSMGGSDPLLGAAKDSACDCLATLAAIAGTLISMYAHVPSADGWAGVLVALFIVWQGVGVLREAGSKLLGQAPDRAQLDALRACILKSAGVLGVHDVRLFSYGPQHLFATAHVERDASEPAMLSHEALDRLEREVRKELGIDLTSHLDPVDLNDEEAITLERAVRERVRGMIEGLDLHDFRLVRGAKKTLVFEAAVPFACKQKEKEIAAALAERVKSLGDYDCSVWVERQ